MSLKSLFILVLVFLAAPVLRLGPVTVLDSGALMFVATIALIRPHVLARSLYTTRFVFPLALCFLIGISTSLLRTHDQSSHLIASIPPLVAIVTMWLFAGTSASVFEGKSEKLLHALGMICTLGALTVVIDGVSHGLARGQYDVSRQTGLFEHPIEAGYMAGLCCTNRLSVRVPLSPDGLIPWLQ